MPSSKESEEEYYERLIRLTAKERKQKDAVQKRLENKYADRGLKFTSGFRGSVPTQACGVIDGYIFYFRYRFDCAQLRVGFIAKDRYELEYARDMKFHEERMIHAKAKREKEKALTGTPYIESTFDKLMNQPPEKRVANGIDDIPTSLRKTAFIDAVFNDPYNGTLTAEQCESIFIKLVESMEDCEYETPVTVDD